MMLGQILNANMAFLKKLKNLMNNNLSLNILYKIALQFEVLINTYCVHDNLMRLAFKKVGLGFGCLDDFLLHFEELIG